MLHYNGLPIDARSVTDGILAQEKAAHGMRPRRPPRPRRRRPTASTSTSRSYRGSKTTLCAGCGHNAISERIIDAFFEMGVDPKRVIKLSGIGCSSKSPAYFLNPSHGFNSVHGRMPSVATGAMLANKDMLAIGVSGDGDTGAIGIGQFVHLMRRNLPLIYIIEDNGCYGLTKGQFSPTADLGSKAKNGVVNDLPPIDTCALAIELGASFVARSFSGDKKQLLSVLKAAIAHRGTSMIDVISPCVTFNDHEGSTKSYAYVKDHDEPLGEISFVPFFEDITRRVRGRARRPTVKMHDGSQLYLRKVAEDYNPSDKIDGDAAAARDGAPRRVRDRHHLHRAGQGRLPRHRSTWSTSRWRSARRRRARASGREAVLDETRWKDCVSRRQPESRVNRPDMTTERTFAIIKPDAVKAGLAGRILARIEEAGFTVRGMRLTHLSKREAEGFYAVHARGRSSAA